MIKKLIGLISGDPNKEEKEHGKARSPEWERVRKEYLKTNPKCAVCGSTEKVQVHHVLPYHLHPELELNPNNFITLCEIKGTDHHLNVGHRGSFQDYNPNVRENAQYLWENVYSKAGDHSNEKELIEQIVGKKSKKKSKDKSKKSS